VVLCFRLLDSEIMRDIFLKIFKKLFQSGMAGDGKRLTEEAVRGNKLPQ
jgi:hypothetical protein